MRYSPTLTPEEFSSIHNGLCYMRFAIDDLEKILSPTLLAKLNDARDKISAGLARAYEEEENDFRNRNSEYERVAVDLNLTSVWSVEEVSDMNSQHLFTGATKVIYKDHWGKSEVSSPIPGSTWADLYKAADACIAKSGDDHHIFIEGFKQKDDVLILSTGS